MTNMRVGLAGFALGVFGLGAGFGYLETGLEVLKLVAMGAIGTGIVACAVGLFLEDKTTI